MKGEPKSLVEQRITKKTNNKIYNSFKITIDKPLIRKLGWKKGDIIEQESTGNILKLKKVQEK